MTASSFLLSQSLACHSREYQRTLTQIYVKLKNDGLKCNNTFKTSAVHKFIKDYDGTIVVTDKERKIWILHKAISGEFKDWPVKSNKFQQKVDQRRAFKKNKAQPRKVKNRNKPKALSREEQLKEYHDYLKTPKWRTISQAVIKRDGSKCTKCNSTHILHAHHKTYKNIFNEMNHLEDLITLCKECHVIEHKKKR